MHLCPRHVFLATGQANATAHANYAPRRSSGTSRSWASSSSLLRLSSFATPDQRADSTPGIPFSASTQRPLSSASDGKPGRRDRSPGLDQRVALEGRLGLGRLGVGRRRRRARAPRRRGSAAARIRRSSSSFARVAAGQAAPASRRRLTPAPPLHPGQLRAPAGREVEQLVEQRRGRTARPPRCPAPR